jgi:hypothetical protein
VTRTPFDLRALAWGLVAAMLLAFGVATPALAEAPREVVLSGELHDSDNQTYRELPFDVPAGVTKVSVAITYSGRREGTILVFGLFDPQRLRGWGGGIKRDFTVAEAFASPSFLPGPIPPGRWRLSLGVASIRKGTTSSYTARIRFSGAADLDVITEGAIRPGPGWYRGDLHSHTGHSDGACTNPAGRPAPCPLFLTLQAAQAHGLDFIAITDHNVTSHYAEMADLAPYFDTLLLIPGREITTAQGHFNLIGATRYVDFQLRSSPGRDMNTVIRDASATGGLVVINHPEIPTGEDCLGCGWSAKDTDYGHVDAIEIANGGVASDHGGFPEGQGSGIGFWEAQLNAGRHITGVGGSDNHNAVDHPKSSPVGLQSPVGVPATVVFADDLSQAAILKGLRSGRVFVDLENVPGRVLDLAASSAGARAVMGGTLARRAGEPVEIDVDTKALAGARLQLVVDGRPAPEQLGVASAEQTLKFQLAGASCARWARVDARNAAGARIAISNPIFFTLASEGTGASNCYFPSTK